MKLYKLTELLLDAQARTGPDTEVLLCFEEGAMENGYQEDQTEGISDVRLIDDWPLPGDSLMAHEGEKPRKLVIFYDNHYKLADSSKSE